MDESEIGLVSPGRFSREIPRRDVSYRFGQVISCINKALVGMVSLSDRVKRNL